MHPLDGKEIQDLPTMTPWFRGFKGTIDELDDSKYIVNGEISEISDTKVEITELPIRTWTQDYKEKVCLQQQQTLTKIGSCT